MALTPGQRRELRGRAHGLKPVVQTGAQGLSDAVVAEIEIALEHHELIKLRLAGVERDQRGAMADDLCRRLKAERVALIGHVLILYRPTAKAGKAAKPAKAANAVKAVKPGKAKR